MSRKSTPYSFWILLFVLILSLSGFIYAQEEEPPLDQPESDIPMSAPTNMSNVYNLLNAYKEAIEKKDGDKYLACISQSFQKEIKEAHADYTNRYYLTYLDIERGVREDNFSQYQGKTVQVSYVINSVSFNYMEVIIKLALTVKTSPALPGPETRNETLTLLWNEEEDRWQIASF